MVTIIVLVKQTPDVDAIRIDSKTGAPDFSGVGVKVSDYDKHAVEAAVALKEKHAGSKIIAISLGGPKVEESLKEVLAMGCDEAVVLRDPAFDAADTAARARVIAAAITKIGGADLVLAAEESADSHSAQMGPRVAEHLGAALISYVAENLTFGDGKVRADRDIDEGIETVEAATPAVLTILESLNTPRLPALMQILQAKNKPITVMSAADVGLDAITRTIDRAKTIAPKSERKGLVIDGSPEEAAAELAKTLVKAGVVG